ncbi:MAG: PQQ-dependent sugar dehydrogenase [Acidobacteria bacterium]|nr:PQQ-dependent sugar dehydrogenase [Acidobacteriota bacterium]
MKAPLLSIVAGCGVWAAVLLPGYTEAAIATGLNNPTAFAVAPDGRVFVAEQGGALRVVSAAGGLLSTPVLDLAVDSAGERGLIGIALDPDFAANQYVYLYHTVPGAAGIAPHNRVTRYTLNGNTVVSGSETLVQNLEPLGATNHNGGALRFGPDGKLYVAVGENAVPLNSQDLSNRLGKILRLNPDGSTPSDNPFVGTTGASPQIWALGLRNPYQFAFDALTGRVFINDVGSNQFEEINVGGAGRNYGWPGTEGHFNPASFPAFTNPLHAYDRSGGCAITGGAFSVSNEYFFADFCNGTIRRLDLSNNSVTAFASGIPFGLVDIAFSETGDLYYLFRGTGTLVGSLYLIDFPGAAEEVPEPGPAVLSALGLAALLLRLRRR